MQITATPVVELDETEGEQFEQDYWPSDEHYEGVPYFQGRESGPFLVDLESVCYETREWLEKYNGGWEGFRIDFTAKEHTMIQALAHSQKGLLEMTLYPTHALLYFQESFLIRLIHEMAHDAIRKDVSLS